MRYVSAERPQLKCGVSEELSEQIRRVQDLESSKQGKAVNIEGALEAAVSNYLERNDPLEKAKRAQRRAEKRNVSQAATKDVPLARKDVPAANVDPYFIPVYLGGKTVLSNLRTLCSFCHKRLHRLAGTPLPLKKGDFRTEHRV
jgi:hypothetical protein